MKYAFAPILAVGMFALPLSAMAGGIMLYEVGTDNVGLANAGAAARAQGPSTLASNVAGMALLKGTQITAAGQLLHSNLEFHTDSDTNIDGGDSGNALEWLPGGSFFVTQELNDGWSVGFAAYGDFGLSLNYDNDWQGRYFLQNGSIIGMTLMPSVAYRINDQWAVGLGARAFYAALDSKMAVDNDPLGVLDRPDGRMKYKDNDWALGGNLGVIYEPREGTRLGLSYTSEIHVKFEDRMNLEGLGPVATTALGNRGVLDANTNIDMNVPQTLTLSLFQQLDTQWALLGSLGWQDWSRFDEIGIDLDSANPHSATLNTHYRDTWHASVGAQYRFDPQWLWNMGLAYDSSAVSDHNRSLTVPTNENWRLGTGFTYSLDKNTDINFSYELVWMGDMSVDQQKPLPLDDPKRVSGEFDNAWIQAFAGSVTWRF